jgi:hypothetical protein
MAAETMENWAARVENAIGTLEVEMDISTLIALVLAARSATYWQARCQGKDELIEELRRRILWLENRSRPESRANIPVFGGGSDEE